MRTIGRQVLASHSVHTWEIVSETLYPQMAEVKDENGRKERFYLYYDGESVAGKVNVTLHRKTGSHP